MSFIPINDARTYYEIHGEGPETIMFAHGLLMNHHMFDYQVEAFRKQYRCIRFDFRGHGNSEITPNGYDMESLTDDTAKLIRELNDKPCHFLGFSMGGFVGLRLAIQYPELLNSLVIVDSSAGPEPKMNILKYKLMNVAARWLGTGAVAGRVLRIMFSKSFLKNPDRAEERRRWRKFIEEMDPRSRYRAVNGVINREDVFDEIDRITLPVLILVGEQDRATPPEKSRRMHERIPNSELAIIPGSGHTAPIEKPADVNRSLKRFLSKVTNDNRRLN